MLHYYWVDANKENLVIARKSLEDTIIASVRLFFPLKVVFTLKQSIK